MMAADPIGVAQTVVAHRAAVAAAGRAVHRAVVRRRWTVAVAPAGPIGVAQTAVARMMMMVVVVACSCYRLCPSMLMFSYASLYKITISYGT
jgi:threonine dehydrogenase-like Zn-dependent dehydrogenase